MRTIEVDGVDHTDSIRLDSLAIVEAAFGGEVGIGGFNRDDLALDDVPAMKLVTVDESVATPDRMFTGFTSVRGLDRGPLARQENLRQWDVTILDLNTCLDDEVFQTSTANRPSETDFARVSWLLDTPAVMQSLGITAGVVPNTNTVTMDAIDYRGATPRRVLDECAEAAKKNFFLYNYGAGHKLYYDLATGTSLSSALTLSTDLSDVDFSTCFPFDVDPHRSFDPTRVYSTVRFEYEGGVVTVTDAAIEAEFRRREITINDPSVKSAAKATNKANAYLDAVRAELSTFVCAVSLPRSLVNDIRAGQRIQVKVPHLGFSSLTWMRISRREVTPRDDENYTVALEFAEDLRPVRFGGPGGGIGGGPPASPCFDVFAPEEDQPACNDVGNPQDFDIDVGPLAQQIIIWQAYITANQDITITWTEDGEIYKGVDSEYPYHKAWATARIYQDASWTDPDVPPTADDLDAFVIAGSGPFLAPIIQIGGSYSSAEGPQIGWRPFDDTGGDPAAAGSPAVYALTTGLWAVIYVNSYRQCINVAHADYPQSPFLAAAGIRWEFTVDLDSSYDCLVVDPAVIGRVCQGKVYGPVTLFPDAGVYTFPYPFTEGTLVVMVGGTLQIPLNVDIEAHTFELADDPGIMIVQAYGQIPADFQL